MKIRDLRHYINALCGGDVSQNDLGSDQEAFLKKMSGSGQSLTRLIIEVASFANKAEEQLFYEFVQNAYDAKADSLFFYANQHYLIVLNNGDPFYTDINIFDQKSTKPIREGQLYNFLAKGKSQKWSKENLLGKYGQGSKLLYTLLADVDNNTTNEALLIKAIKENKLGPYIVSWQNKSQLDLFLINKDEWDPISVDDDVDHLLFAKILMSYYPVTPEQDGRYFNKKEARDVIKVFGELVDPKRNMSYLTKGTALIIPLGKGKFNSIISEDNLKNVRERLGVFSSLLAGKNFVESGQLKHIYVMNQEVEQYTVQSLSVKCHVNNSPFIHHFAFNPAFADKNVVNFYRDLPILETKYGFGFIVDNQIFDVDTSRQRLLDVEKASEQLKVAFKYMIEELYKIKQDDYDKYKYICVSIIASRPNDVLKENLPIVEAFNEIIKPFISENVITSKGGIEPIHKVYENTDKLNVELSELGIDAYWLDDNLKDDYAFYLNGSLRKYELPRLLRDANTEMRTSWIKAMNIDVYKQFHEICVACKNEINDLEVFRSNKGELYSWDDLRSSKAVFYLSNDIFRVNSEIEYIQEKFLNKYAKRDVSILLLKIIENIALFRGSSFKEAAICSILYRLSRLDVIDDKQVNFIKGAIPLFKNMKGDFLPFLDLLEERPKDTILYDDFRVSGSIPSDLLNMGWLQSERKDPTAFWDWIVRHIDDLKQVQGWGKYTKRYIADILYVFKQVKGNKNVQSLPFYLNQEGFPVDEEHFYVDKFRNISQLDYNILVKKFDSICFLPYEYLEELSQSPFFVKTVGVSDFMDASRGDLLVDLEMLRILTLITTDFFDEFYVIEENHDKFLIRQLNTGSNFINELPPDLRALLHHAEFHYIPSKVQSLVSGELYRYLLTTESNAFKLIAKLPNRLELFPIVVLCSHNVVNMFLNNIESISIDRKLCKDDLEWKVINQIGSNPVYGHELKIQILKKLRHKGECLPLESCGNTVSINEKEYNLSDLFDDFSEGDRLINSFYQCLPSSTESQWFHQEYYGRTIVKDAVEVYNELKSRYLSIPQLIFCLDYSINIGTEDLLELEVEEGVSMWEVLEQIKSNHFTGFDKYLKMPGLDCNTQVYAKSELLLDDERLPEEIQKWLEKNPEESILFSQLYTIDNPLILIRKNILEGDDVISLKQDLNPVLLQKSIRWLLSKSLSFEYGSKRFKNVTELIKKDPSDLKSRCFLKFIGKVGHKREKLIPIFELHEYNHKSCFMSYSDCTQSFMEILNDSEVLRRYFDEHCVYLDYMDIKSIINKIQGVEFMQVHNRVSDEKCEEMNSEPYLQWKKHPGSKGIVIKLTKFPVSIRLSLIRGEEEVFSLVSSDREFGYEDKKMLVVQYSDESKVSPLKVIESHISDIDFFKEPFILLQGLYISYLEKKNAGNIQVDDHKVESVQRIASEFNLDELTKISMNKDSVLKALMKDPEEEPLVNMIVGYLGEMIYKLYLNKLDVDYTYSAEQEIGAYDFENLSDGTFIDVKTTVTSLKTGRSPFYLHKSQSDFLQSHPDNEYRIVRISLTDINVKNEYDQIRNRFEENTDPRNNKELANACEQLANSYWQKNTINNFKSHSPTYQIKFEHSNQPVISESIHALSSNLKNIIK